MNTVSLSLLRFIAAIVVILFHNKGESEFLKIAPKILSAGTHMVTFFFVLSGFTLVVAYYKKEKLFIREFYIKRIAKIFPIYLLALILSCIIEIIEGNLDILALILNIFLLQSWFPPYPLSINSPGWFLSVLVFFYALFPIALSYLKKFNPDPRRILLIGLLIWVGTQSVLTYLLNTSFYKGFPSCSHDLIFYFPLSHCCSFILGLSGAYYLLAKDKQFYVSSVSSICTILLLLFLLIMLIENESIISKLTQLKFSFESSFYAPLFLILVVIFSNVNSNIMSKLSIRPFVILGEISFFIYILQKPIRVILFYVLSPVGIHYDVFIIIHILVLISVGMVLLKTIECPLRVYVKNKFK